MIIKRDMYYWPAQQNRTLHIWLPDNYNYTGERYPVMYMFDGHNLFYDHDATYGKSWGIREFLEGWSKQIIIVGMECSHEGNRRLAEYCPYNRRMFGNEIHGIGEQTYQWMINDVKPMIDRDYRTYGHREATAVGGSSMGGLMSLYGILVHNDVFSKAACVSTGVFWNLGNLRRELETHDINPDTRVYLSWGEMESGRAPNHGDPAFATREARSVRKFSREIEERGADTHIFFQYGGRHCEADWEKQVPHFMDYLWFGEKY